MIVRKLDNSEIFEGKRISMIAFHGTMPTEEEKERVRKEAETTKDMHYGAFSDDGKLMARMINNKFVTRFDGHCVITGGIGGVSTLPEYRETGCVRHIFHKLLPDAYKDGEIFSYLYPFNISFYRKFGYETITTQREYEFSPSVLKDYHFHGEAALYHDGEPAVAEFLSVYEQFAKDYNVAVVRDESSFYENKLKGDYFKDRKFAYLLRENGKAAAYIIFADENRTIAVKDMAFIGKKGLYAVLGFLSRFTADYQKIKLYLPAGIELFSVLKSKDIYEVEDCLKQSFMGRVVNAKEALKLLRKPENTRFVIQVTGDEQIEQNNRTYLVTNEDVLETEHAPDLEVSIQSLAQLALGATDLFEASFRDDTEIIKNEEMLARVFVHKPRMMQNFF